MTGWKTFLGAAAIAYCAGALAQETTLVLATTFPPNIHVSAQMLHPWADRVNEKGKGVLQIVVRDGPTVANFSNFYDRVMSDVVQIAWGLQSTVAGKFPRSDVVALPFIVDKSEDGAAAFWRLYKTGLLDAEYDEIVPIMLVALTPAGVHTSKPLKSLTDLTGTKLIVASKITGQAVAHMGGTPLSIPLNDMYEALQRGTADGAAVAWTSFQPFKLAEVTFYHVEASLGTSVGMVFMSKKKYQAMPAAARKVLDAFSGEAESRRFGAFWDRVRDEGRKLALASPHKRTIVNLTPADSALWRKKTEPVVDEWAKTTPNGQKILATYRKLLADVKAGK